MTVIAAYQTKDVIVMGADSSASYDCDGFTQIEARKERKICRFGKLAMDSNSALFMVGCAGNIRVSQVVLNTFVPPEMDGWTGLYYMVKRFIPALAGLVESQAHIRLDDEAPLGGSMLVAMLDPLCHRYLFEIGADYQVGSRIAPYNAIGSGAMPALGALHALHTSNKRENRAPYNFVEAALESADAHCGTVCPPFHIEEL